MTWLRQLTASMQAPACEFRDASNSRALHKAEDVAACAEKYHVVAGRISLVELQFVIWDQDYGSARNVRAP